MEDRIQLLLDKFSCHDSTHPLLTKLWVEALKECKSKISIIEKTIEQGEELIEKIPNSVNDPDISTIITLFSIGVLFLIAFLIIFFYNLYYLSQFHL